MSGRERQSQFASTFIEKNLDTGRKDRCLHSPNSAILLGALAMVRLRRVDFGQLRSSSVGREFAWLE
jgi:hypothetical protein